MKVGLGNEQQFHSSFYFRGGSHARLEKMESFRVPRSIGKLAVQRSTTLQIDGIGLWQRERKLERSKLKRKQSCRWILLDPLLDIVDDAGCLVAMVQDEDLQGNLDDICSRGQLS